MNPKKEVKKNMDRYKSLFFQFGLLMSLALVLFAFEWKSFGRNEPVITNKNIGYYDDTDYVIPVKNDPPPPPPKQAFDLNVVEDDVETIDLEVDAEFDLDEKIVMSDPVPEFEEDYVVEDEKIVLIPGDAPAFPGGERALYEYLAGNIVYPRIAREINLQGTVYLSFVIEKDGSISNVIVQRGIGSGCDEEAVRVVKNMPKWSPGRQYGRPVRVQCTLPVKFVLL